MLYLINDQWSVKQGDNHKYNKLSLTNLLIDFMHDYQILSIM